MVQWLRLRASNASGVGSISGGSAKFPHATMWQKKKKKSQQQQKIIVNVAHISAF